MLLESLNTQAWQAELALQFARRDAATVLTRREHRGPLRVQKALYPEGEEVCHAIVLHPPAGIAGGDELSIALQVEAGAHALLTTPGAGKWYRSAGPWALQHTRFEVGADACLEWLPQETIFFNGCQAAIDSEIRLAPGAHFLGWDVWCLGRNASGEQYTHGRLHNRNEIFIGNDLLWCEQGQLAGDSALLHSPAGLDGRHVCATLIAAGSDLTPEVLTACRGVVAQEHDARYGVTHMPKLFLARYLGRVVEAARAWLFAIWHLLRPALMGRAALAPRIWST